MAQKSLAESEILFCLKNFECIASLDQLRNPNKEFMIKVLSSFMRLLEIDVEAMLHGMLPNAMQTLVHPELYEGIINVATFYYTAEKLLIPAGITDLSITDILDPKPKRTKKILNHLIVLWKHVIEKNDRAKDISDKMELQNKKQDSLRKTLDALTTEHDQLVSTEANSMKMEEIQLECSENETKLNEIIEVSKSKSETHRNLKLDIAKEQVSINDLNVAVISEKESLDDIRSKILSSPDRFRTDIDETEEKCTEQDSAVSKLLNEKEKKNQQLLTLKKDISNVQEFITSSKMLIDKEKPLRKELLMIHSMKKEQDAIDASCKESGKQISQAKQSLAAFEQRNLQLDVAKNSEVHCANQISQMLQKSLQAENQVVKELEANVNALKRQDLESEKTLNKLQIESKYLVEKFEQQFSQKQNRMGDYFEENCERIEAATAAMQKYIDKQN